MFTTLVESKAARERRRGGTALSIIAHTTVITLAVYATVQAHTVRRTDGHIATLIYHAPRPPKPAVPSPAPIPLAPPAGPISMPTVDVPTGIHPANPLAAPIDTTFWANRALGNSPTGTPEAVSTVDQVFFAPQVEKVAAVAPGSAQPSYPDMLRTAGVTGGVIGRFVVDTLGRVEAGSFKALQTDNDMFTDAVKAVLSKMRFYPAEVAGRRVRQMVEQRFSFELK